MNDFGSSAWSAVVTVSTTKKPQTSEDLQRAVTKGDVETVRNILPGKFTMLMFFFRYFSNSFYRETLMEDC